MAQDPKNFLLGPRGAKPKPSKYVKGLIYHTTDTDRVDKIKEEGIRPQPVENRQWDKPAVNPHTDEHVYAFVYPHGAFAHAARQESRTGKKQSVLAVKVPVKDDVVKGGWKADLMLHDGNRFRDDLGPVKKKGIVKPKDIVDVHHLNEDKE